MCAVILRCSAFFAFLYVSVSYCYGRLCKKLTEFRTLALICFCFSHTGSGNTWPAGALANYCNEHVCVIFTDCRDKIFRCLRPLFSFSVDYFRRCFRLVNKWATTKRSGCDDYGPALNSAWSYLERNSQPWLTALSVWRLLVHGTVFQTPVSLQLLPITSFKRQLKSFLFAKSFP